MISSAVVVPESETASSSPTLKRRLSSASDDSNKRARIAPRADLSISPTEEVSNAILPSPTQRRTSAFGAGLGAAEEKKRGQRLFGSLLGTLSQKGTKPAHKKRDEIEARQRERLKRDDEERESERQRRKAELDRIRRAEQEEWEEEGVKLRHRNMRATAGFLQTKTEPRLFYKPWEWRSEEEEQVRRQRKEVEEVITCELSEHAVRKNADADMTSEIREVQTVEPPESSEIVDVRRESPKIEEDADGSNKQGDADSVSVEKVAINDDGVDDANDQQESTNASSKPPDTEKPNHDDHHGEELVEGQEDDVIY